VHVNLDTGENFVNINAVKIAHQAVKKAMEIVAAVHPASGEIIVTTNACTTVPLQNV
jgi:hypothetical protein